MFGLNEAQIALLMRTNGIMSDMRSMGAPYVGRFGTFADGDYNPGANATLTKNMYMWRDVNIGAGITITVPSPGVLIFARDVTISGLLTATGKGAAGGAGTTASTGVPGQNGGGIIGGRGGKGAQYGSSPAIGGDGGAGAKIKNALIDVLASLPFLAGGGGGSGNGSSGNVSGAGGGGGGYIYLSCNTLTINTGAIRADGLAGYSNSGYSGGGGGGGGGGIIIVAKDIVNNGNITSNGGTGGSSYSGWSPGSPGENGTVLLLEVA